MAKTFEKITVLGAGSWGAALSLLLTGKGCRISMWVWDLEQAETMKADRVNPFLPDFPLPESMSISISVPEAVEDADAVLFAPISKAVSNVSEQLKTCLPPGIPIISGTKGLSGDTGLTVSQTLAALLPSNPIAALSGPNLAVELAKGIPTATVIASADNETALDMQNLFMSENLRVYTNSDVVGVELAGALKNVIAIAAGICDGLGFGDNTKAALLTRGLAEITRLGVKIGARQETFMGLAGVGDLIATCASPLSRNFRVGLGLGQGRNLDEIVQEIGQTAEGIPTAWAAFNLAQKHGVPMPITEQVHEVLFAGKPPKDALADLMAREPKKEIW